MFLSVCGIMQLLFPVWAVVVWCICIHDYSTSHQRMRERVQWTDALDVSASVCGTDAVAVVQHAAACGLSVPIAICAHISAWEELRASCGGLRGQWVVSAPSHLWQTLALAKTRPVDRRIRRVG